jgi:hypothetical protein
MSLIEEALRRAQQPSSKAGPMVTTTPEPISEPTPLTPSSALPHRWSRSAQPRLVNATWWIGLAIGGTALIMLMLWGYSLLLRWQLAKDAVPEVTPSPRVVQVTSRLGPVQPTATAKPALNPPAAATPAPAKRKRPDLTLNGTVEGRGEPVAIINGMILRIGDSIAGATLLEIWGEEARLRWRDQDLILSTTR